MYNKIKGKQEGIIMITKQSNARPQVTRAELITKLQRKGVQFENTKNPFTKDSRNISLIGKFEKLIEIK